MARIYPCLLRIYDAVLVSSLLTLRILNLTHSLPMHPFSNPWKHRKNLWFPEVKKGCIGSEWVNIQLIDLAFLILTMDRYLPVVYLHLLTFIVDFEQGNGRFMRKSLL